MVGGDSYDGDNDGDGKDRENCWDEDLDGLIFVYIKHGFIQEFYQFYLFFYQRVPKGWQVSQCLMMKNDSNDGDDDGGEENLHQLPMTTGPVFCLLLGVSSGCARPITGQVTSVTWPVIGWA